MSVFVFDGDHPGFSWYCTIGGLPNSGTIPIGVGGSLITDPDVVLTHDGTNALIVYIQNNRCYYESKVWNSGTNAFVANQPATLLSTATGTNCLSPNVDIAYYVSLPTPATLLAATWTENGTTVKGCAGSFSGGLFSFSANKVTLNASLPGPYAYTPDVCVYKYIEVSGACYPTVTFTFITANATPTEYLFYSQMSWGNLNGGITPPPATYLNTYATYPNTLSKPRIAAPIDNLISLHTDFEIVVASYQTGGNWSILGYNKYQGAPYTTTVINGGTVNTVNLYNGEPVVTYGGDFIQVSWIYLGNGILPPPNVYPNDIIARKLTWWGSVNQTANFSVVNYVVTGNQICPAIASRYCPNHYVLYAFYDQTKQYIKYKHSTWNAISLRLRNPAIGEDLVTNIYPNPATDNITVDLSSDEGWAGAEMEILNIQGQTVKKLIITDVSTTIDVSGLKNGLYFMKLTNNENMILKKIIINR